MNSERNKSLSGMLVIDPNRIIHMMLIIISYLLLEHEYKNFVFPLFENTGFGLFECSMNQKIMAILMLTISLFVIMFVNYSGFIYAVSVIVHVLMFIPGLIMYKHGGTSIMIPVFTLFLILLLNIRYFPDGFFNRIPVVKKSQQIPLLIILSILFMIPFLEIFGLNFNFRVFTFGSIIYEIRAVAGTKSNLLTAYGFGQLTKAILPPLIIFGILRRNHLIWIIGVIIMIYLFLIIPQKSVFFSIFAIILFIFYRKYENKISLFILIFLGLVIASVVFTRLGYILPESIIIRRFLFLPVLITHKYFIFFNDNYMYLSDTMFGLTEYPYSLEPPYLIGKEFFGSAWASFNTGFIGDAFMNFGYAGVLVVIVFVSMIMNFFDNLKLSPAFFGLAFIYFFQLSNSGFLTSLLTHGGILLMLIMLFLLRRRHEA